MSDRAPHWMGERDYARENADHDRLVQEDYEEAQEAADLAAAERFNEDHRGAHS